MMKSLTALYGLKWNPFSPEIPNEALLTTPAIDHFCWRVEHLIREGGFTAPHWDDVNDRSPSGSVKVAMKYGTGSKSPRCSSSQRSA